MAQYSDQVYGAKDLSQLQEALGDSSEVRKTRNVRALGLARFVYRGATNTRENHLFGTSLLASEFGKVLDLGDTEIKYLEAAGILHDIGHPPFSHAAQDYFEEKFNIQQESTSQQLIEDENSEVNQILRSYGLTPNFVSSLILNKDFLLHFGGAQFYLKQLISSDLDCDRLDYLLRDSLHAAPHGKSVDYKRLIQCARLHDNKLVFHEEAKAAIDGCLGAYKDMYLSVYYNNKVKALEAMLEKALFLKHDVLKSKFSPDLTEHHIEDILCDGSLDSTPEHTRGTRLAEELFRGKAYKDAFYLLNTPIHIKEYHGLKLAVGSFKDLEERLLKETGLQDGDILVLDNIKEPKPRVSDLLILEGGTVYPHDQIIDITSYDRNKRHRYSLRILTDEANVPKVRTAMETIIIAV